MRLPVRDFNFIKDPSHATTTGFIAQEFYDVFPSAVTTNGDNGVDPLGASSSPWSLDYGRITPLIVKAVQDIANLSDTFKANLIAWLASADNGITDLFAKNLYASNVTAEVGTFQTTNASTTNADTGNFSKLCITDSANDPNPICVTKSQLAALLSQSTTPAAPISVALPHPIPVVRPHKIRRPTSRILKLQTTKNSSSTPDHPEQRGFRCPPNSAKIPRARHFPRVRLTLSPPTQPSSAPL